MKYVPKNVSIYDALEGVDSVRELEDNNKLASILYQLGMDVKRPFFEEGEQYEGWKIKVCIHKTLRGETKEGIMFCGAERQDEVWLNSGYATQEAKIFSTDKSLMREIKEISRR